MAFSYYPSERKTGRGGWLRLSSPGLLLTSLGCMLGCSAYDSGLLQPVRTRFESVQVEAAAPDCEGPNGDCGFCGDGLIGPGESCDPPETCLTADVCASTNRCVIARFSGDPANCTARCELQALNVCKSGDGCCPAKCRSAIDSDCSTSCGDGIVDPVAETCEPESASQPCQKNCDDGNACTEDHSIGSFDNCNLDCMHSTISDARDGDGCCPRGANAGTDSDCRPACGNGVVEQGEECDGDEECNGTCKRAVAGECQRALASAVDMSDACKACACDRCSSRVLGCLMSGDARRDASCSAIAACTRRSGCSSRGGGCYCGTVAGCAFPSGACKDEIEAAVGSNTPNVVLLCGSNPTCPVTRAYAQDSCLRQNCAAQCQGRSPE